jgi:hypothetical protein
MYYKKIYFLACLLIITSTVAGQSSFLPGFIINPEEDTIHGYINDHGKNSRYYKECVFKDTSGNISEYTPDEIKGYKIEDGRYFLAKKVEKDTTTKSVFLEFLLDGIMNVYQYRKPNKKVYYIEKDNKLVKLENEMKTKYFADGTVNKVPTKKYTGILKALIEEPDLYDDIDNMRLETKPLVGLVQNYHNRVCEDEECITYEARPLKIDIAFKPLVSYNFRKLGVVDGGTINDWGNQYVRILNNTFDHDILYGFSLHLTSNRYKRWSVIYNFKIGGNYRFNKQQLYEDGAWREVKTIYGGAQWEEWHVEYDREEELKMKFQSHTLKTRYTYTPSKLNPFIALGMNYSLSNQTYNFNYVPMFEYEMKEPTLNEVSSKHHLGFVIDLGVSYPLMNDLNLELMGYYSKSRSFITTSDKLGKFWFTSFGLTLGTSYSF